MEGKVGGGEEDMAQKKVVDKMWSNWVSHQSGSGEEDEKGELQNKGTEVNVGVEAIIALHRIHAKLNTWVIHHP